jgi:hypothetical protein
MSCASNSDSFLALVYGTSRDRQHSPAKCGRNACLAAYPLSGKPDIEPTSPNDRVWTHLRHWEAQDFRSAKALFVLCKKSVISFLLLHGPHRKVTWQSASGGENSLSPLAAWRPRGRSRRARSRRMNSIYQRDLALELGISDEFPSARRRTMFDVGNYYRFRMWKPGENGRHAKYFHRKCRS